MSHVSRGDVLLLIGASIFLGNLALYLMRASFPSPIAASIVLTALGGALFCLALRIPD